MKISLLILGVGLLQYTMAIKVVVMGLTPKATSAYNCFYEGNPYAKCPASL